MRLFSTRAANLAVRATVRKAAPIRRTAAGAGLKSAAASPRSSSPPPPPAASTNGAASFTATTPLESAPVEAATEPVRSVPNLTRKADSSAASEMPMDESMVSSLEALEDGTSTPDTPEVFSGDWSSSFQGLGSAPFPREAADILLAPVAPNDVEITPDGLIYLPEIKYRRILNRAFGPGGWGIVPRTKTLVTKRQVTREYGLICLGRLVSVSRGEMDFFNAEGVTTAMEGCKSNALMRCCKDLGIASELWDPGFIREFKAKHCDTKYFEKKKRFAWKRKDRQWEYPYV